MIIKALRNFISMIGLIVILPFLIAAALLIIIEDGFPVFFQQKRLGLNQKIFTIYKLRTLKKNAPQVGTHLLDECHKLKTGRIIRALKLDEFPQLFNVIKGDLNLIGPRPGLESQAELAEARFSKGVHQTKPGITGLSQILGYDMSNPLELAKVDKIYIDNQSFQLKLIILMGTFFTFPRKHLSSRFKLLNTK